MKKILIVALIINAVAVSLLLSCFFETERDNPYDPKSSDYSAKIYMFESSLADGNMSGAGGRAGADDLCELQLSMLTAYNLPGDNVHAFISVDGNDEISDMQANYGVPTDREIISTSGITIASNWNDLLSGILINTVQDANVTLNNYWWSGTLLGGSVAAETCGGWTDTGLNGRYGMTDYDSSTFYAMYTGSCSSVYPVLCICWK